MKAYVDAAVMQARQRAKVLKGKIPSPLKSPEASGLQRFCEQHLDQAIGVLDYLMQDPAITNPKAGKERLRVLRRTIEEISQLEATGIAALNRHDRDDAFLNRLVFAIHQEIQYPLLPPSVSCLSRDYYMIYPSLGLLTVPLAESHFLLHLPDLYHEIAHPLLLEKDNPKVEPFQEQFAGFLHSLAKHFEGERRANERSTGPRQYLGYVLDVLERSWIQFWAAELFCDLFGVITVGPAYAWAHLHLTATRESDPFLVRTDRLTSHPPAQARMEAILAALELLDRGKEAAEIRARWDELLRTMGAATSSSYKKACPKELLEAAAVYALEGVRKMGCRCAIQATSGRVHDLLNTAWSVFWENPGRYNAWEEEKVRQLRQEYT